jgi:excisionase family DNA binding protein
MYCRIAIGGSNKCCRIPLMKIGDVEVLTLTEAAERLELERSTLFRQIKSGALKAQKSGAIWLIDARDVEKYREEHKGRHGKASPDYPHKRKGDDA